MGKVTGQRYEKVEDICACNEICQSAQGPKCSCKCGGKHHGLSLYIPTVIESGIVKLEASNRLKAIEKAMRLGNEYRAAADVALEAIKRFYGQSFTDHSNGAWIANKTLWANIGKAKNKLRIAKGYKVHKTRMKKLQEIIDEFSSTKTIDAAVEKAI